MGIRLGSGNQLEGAALGDLVVVIKFNIVMHTGILVVCLRTKHCVKNLGNTKNEGKLKRPREDGLPNTKTWSVERSLEGKELGCSSS